MNKIKRIPNYLLFLFRQFRISKDFYTKLEHNYHELTYIERLIYFFTIRKKLGKDDRFFFEGERRLNGQMYKADRKSLYDAILKFKPRYCIEVGTYTGGGSTYFLAKSFEELGSGKLYTLEIDYYLHKLAKDYYTKHLPKTSTYVEFLLGENVSKFKQIIEDYGNNLDCIFLDGAENGNETLEQYNFFKTYLRSGSILMAHDWNTEKTAALKPVLLNDNSWEIIAEIKPPKSVGFVIFRRK
jgi:predicted O-methyltransferase YrrM